MKDIDSLKVVFHGLNPLLKLSIVGTSGMAC